MMQSMDKIFIPAPAGWRHLFVSLDGSVREAPMPGWFDLQTGTDEHMDTYERFIPAVLLDNGRMVSLSWVEERWETMGKHVVVSGPGEAVPDRSCIDWDLLAMQYVYELNYTNGPLSCERNSQQVSTFLEEDDESPTEVTDEVAQQILVDLVAEAKADAGMEVVNALRKPETYDSVVRVMKHHGTEAAQSPRSPFGPSIGLRTGWIGRVVDC